ncbi:MAG: hypothetical protein M1536_05605 [Firmicutes bacterium]|nr:hypothetical protein [Bacillota bacterium]
MVVGEVILLEYKMKKGESLQYKVIVYTDQDFKMTDQNFTQEALMEMVMRQKASDVASDGSMNMDVTIESGSLKREGEELELPTVGSIINMKMQKNGTVTQSSVDFPYQQPPFPSSPVKKGESWNGESRITIPGKDQPETLNYTYTLVGTGKINGHDCAEIKVSCPQKEIELNESTRQVLSASGITYFAYKEGKLVKSEIHTDSDVISKEGVIKTKIKIAVDLLELPSPSLGIEEAYIAR